MAGRSLRFGGGAAAVGLVVFAVFELIAALLALGGGLAVWKVAAARTPPFAALALVATAATLWGGRALARRWGRVTRIELDATDGGTWTLRNAFGRRLVRMAAAPRRVALVGQKRVNLVGAIGSYRVAWLEIDTPGGTLCTWECSLNEAEAALRILGEAAA